MLNAVVFALLLFFFYNPLRVTTRTEIAHQRTTALLCSSQPRHPPPAGGLRGGFSSGWRMKQDDAITSVFTKLAPFSGC